MAAERPACPVCLAPGTVFALKALLHPGCEREIRECPACGAAFYQPMPGPEEISRCYPRAYFRGFFRQYWQDHYKGRSLASRLSAFRPKGRLLDVGCALGTLLAGVRDHSSWTVAGLELSDAAASMGRQLNGVEIFRSGLAGAPWPEASFDCVHANNVLEHDPDPAGAVRAAARLLNKGGRLLLTLPNGPVDLMVNRRLFARHGALPTKHAGHLVFYSRRSLERLLERCGLKVLSARCFHFQLGLKARGWLPGGAKAVLRRPGEAPLEHPLSLDEGRGLIGPRPSWTAYLLRQRLRRLWRSGWSDLGYDLEVAAEKPQ